MHDDFSAFRRSRRQANAPIDPLEIFASLEINDKNIENLWLSQGDALRDWHAHRSQHDVVISMNTGAGKTLVGLLCAQSLVNELRRHVVYVCSTRQLVDQTASHASKYGLTVTQYADGRYSNEEYAGRRVPLITTYQAVFHGLSRLSERDIAAVIFDDAHTAEQILRDQYTLDIRTGDHPDAVSQVQALFRQYFGEIDRLAAYDDLCNSGDPTKYELIPPFVVRQNQASFESLLVAADLGNCEHDDGSKCRYAWAYLSGNVPYCAVFITGSGVVLCPPIFPSLSNARLQSIERRIFLSASLDVGDSFIRTFGRFPDRVIKPKTDAGDCERLILFPGKFRDTEDEQTAAEVIIRDRKALISVPSYYKALDWKDIAVPPQRPQVTKAIENFKAASGDAKLLLVARYDGVDFPGETCQVMAIDGLPKGVSILERFYWERLGIKKGLVTQVASRLLQWFGRISRGKRDYGVFVLVDSELRDWLAENVSLLPEFLQNQILLGLEISAKVSSLDSARDLTDQCLTRREPWTRIYRDAVEDPQFEEPWLDFAALARVAEIEVKLGSAYWDRDWAKVASVLSSNVADEIYKIAPRNLAWYAYWSAYAHDSAGEDSEARRLFKRAAGLAPNILRAPAKVLQEENLDPCLQQGVNIRDRLSPTLLQQLDRAIANIDPEVSKKVEDHHAKVEEGLNILGTALGLEARRPDQESKGSGPDNLWSVPGLRYLGLEVKSEKYLTENSPYTKGDLSQMDDHRRWAKREDLNDYEVCFVGPVRRAAAQANPDDEMFIISLEDFHEIAQRLRPLLADLHANSLPLTMASEAYVKLQEQGLLYRQLLDSLKRVPLVN